MSEGIYRINFYFIFFLFYSLGHAIPMRLSRARMTHATRTTERARENFVVTSLLGLGAPSCFARRRIPRLSRAIMGKIH